MGPPSENCLLQSRSPMHTSPRGCQATWLPSPAHTCQVKPCSTTHMRGNPDSLAGHLSPFQHSSKLPSFLPSFHSGHLLCAVKGLDINVNPTQSLSTKSHGLVREATQVLPTASGTLPATGGEPPLGALPGPGCVCVSRSLMLTLCGGRAGVMRALGKAFLRGGSGGARGGSLAIQGEKQHGKAGG